ncbi:hypothetical protein LHJ74_09415 [Streptomyces sp. N2-109]|uniref:DUF732 domain-containing protein n=1 Tax=Streptomyces gossypii TaxID=2883101 RepID=A0ABT2JQG1_9ACTN|nr:hypothetical protein [Streptomyces gossypii]MCT2590127.1 hypothetical protein [Streptomyces gossypii]
MTAVLLTAVMVLGAGCSGGGEGDGEDGDGKPDARENSRTASDPASPLPSSPSTSAPSSSSVPSPSDGQGAPGPDDEPEDAVKGPKVPAAELTPATGTFTKRQKEYLVDRVPQGTDPAAILEAGKAACDRIGSTADGDRKAAVSALKAGEIANAEDAVRHLCPTFKPLLKAAGLG